MRSEEEPSKKLIVFGLLFFLAWGIVSIYFFYNGMVSLIEGLYLSKPIITLEKTLYYFLGMLVLSIAGILSGFSYRVIKLPSEHRHVKRAQKLLYIGVAIFIIFPQALYFSMDYYLENKKGYHYCRALSTIKLGLSEYVYTQTPELCVKDKAE